APAPRSPRLPGRGAALPEVVEQPELARRVHGLKEVGVLEGDELPVGREALERLALEGDRRVVAEVVPDAPGVENEEAAVDAAGAGLRLLVEAGDEGPVEVDLAEAAGRARGGHRRHLAVLLVEGEEPADVDVRHAVAVREAEEPVLLDVTPDGGDAAGGLRRLARLGEGHVPGLVLGVAAHELDGAALAEVHREIARHRAVVEEELLDE